MNLLHKHLLFVSDLDLRAVGSRVSSSQLSGLSWLGEAYLWSVSLLQFILIPGRSGDPQEGTGSENWSREYLDREGIGLRSHRESLRIEATRV